LITVICALALSWNRPAHCRDLTGFGEGIVRAQVFHLRRVVFVTVCRDSNPRANLPERRISPQMPFTLQITPAFEVPFTCAFSVTR